MIQDEVSLLPLKRSYIGKQLLFLACIATLHVAPALADVKLPAIIASHMVVQRDVPWHIWGTATPGETVSVTFRGASLTTIADASGHWNVDLAPGAAGGPFEMQVRGENAIKLSDILVGDVWLASGQSNMEFSMKQVKNAEAELVAANRPRIRLFHVHRTSSDYPLEDASADPWTACSPESVADFSAVAYFFGKEVQEHQNVPLGLIESSWGGTPAEAWTSLGAFSANASFMPILAAYSKMADAEPAWLIERARQDRETEAAKAAGKEVPYFPWHAELKSWAPAGDYNGMIAPLTRFPIRGVIWYQGESNTDPVRAPLYESSLATLIQDWRQQWGEGDFPFLIVQIANFKTEPDAMWPEVREAQRKVLALRNTGLAVTIDIGDPVNIHPTNKQEVGHRLALAARAIAHSEKIEYSGPLYRQVTHEDHSLRVWFDHAASGLVAEGGVLKGFEIAGPDRHFVPADAYTDGATVVVSSAQVPSPEYVRYDWASSPEGNLYNKDVLPASPFESQP
jgi:sialate O-acetylesterase